MEYPEYSISKKRGGELVNIPIPVSSTTGWVESGLDHTISMRCLHPVKYATTARTNRDAHLIAVRPPLWRCLLSFLRW